MVLYTDVTLVGNALRDLRGFPKAAQQRAGYQLERLQQGETPLDCKPVHSIGPDVSEIRINDSFGTFRVFYAVSRREAIYVLHAFEQITRKTEKLDIDLAKTRLRLLAVMQEKERP